MGLRKQGERSAPCTTHSRMCYCAAVCNLQLLQHLVLAKMHIATHCPEFDEILQYGGCDEQTVHQRVGQEENEKLVIGEPHTVVHPVDAQLHL